MLTTQPDFNLPEIRHTHRVSIFEVPSEQMPSALRSRSESIKQLIPRHRHWIEGDLHRHGGAGSGIRLANAHNYKIAIGRFRGD
jgi:hypothetical protein